MNKDISNKNDLCNKYCDKNKRLPLLMLENQITEDIDGGNDFEVRFVLFVLSALLYPIMKLFVKCFFQNLLEDMASINKMNWTKLVLSYLVHKIQKFNTNKQSEVIPLYIIYFIMDLEFVIKSEVN